MLLSMTGFGSAQTTQAGITIVSEIKTVNNRFLKVNYRISDSFSFIESRLESLIKEHIERGTVNFHLRIVQENVNISSQCNLPLLKSYLSQGSILCEEAKANGESLVLGSVSDYFNLPGVILEGTNSSFDEEEQQELWNAVVANLELSLSSLKESRLREGISMEKNLRSNCDILSREIEQIEVLTPQVLENYRLRLTERVETIMNEKELPFSPADLVREIALFTDRADISEEIVRLRSHIKQFYHFMAGSESCGKKLDFLTQEMFREANTIGSKGNSAEITNHVVELKTTIERIREMVQNVE